MLTVVYISGMIYKGETQLLSVLVMDAKRLITSSLEFIAHLYLLLSKPLSYHMWPMKEASSLVPRYSLLTSVQSILHSAAIEIFFKCKLSTSLWLQAFQQHSFALRMHTKILSMTYEGCMFWNSAYFSGLTGATLPLVSCHTISLTFLESIRFLPSPGPLHRAFVSSAWKILSPPMPKPTPFALSSF